MPEPTSSAARERPQPSSSDLEAAERLRSVLLKLGRRIRAIDPGAGLTPAEFSALATVVRLGPMTPKELAKMERVNPTMLSRMLARMASVGAVSRGADPDDRRVALVAATDAGRQLHQSLRIARAGKLESALAQLLPLERGSVLQALSGLESLVAHLEIDAP